MTVLCCLCAYAMAADAPTPVEFHGYMQNRGYLGAGANPEFKEERISISAAAAMPNDSKAYVEVYYQPWATSSGLYLESAYYDTKLGEGRLRVGKGRRMTFGITPSYPNRKTSNYGIIGEAFTQDRVSGVQYMLNKSNMEIGAALTTAYRLGVRGVGDISGDDPRNVLYSVQHLSFRDLPGTMSQKLELSGRVGGKWLNNTLKAGVSASFSTLDPRDMAFLTSTGTVAASSSTGVSLISTSNTLAPPYPNAPVGTVIAALAPGATNHRRNVYGFDAQYKLPSGWVAQGEYYNAKASSLGYNGWDILGGYETPKNGWKYYIRYAQQNMDTDPTNNPLSWDTKQTTLSIVQPISKTVWMQYEYEINDEQPIAGIAKSKNNLFFAELFTAF